MYEKRTVVLGVLALVFLVVLVLLYNAFVVSPYLFVCLGPNTPSL